MFLRDVSIRVGRCDLCERDGVKIAPDDALFVCADKDGCREANYERFAKPLSEKRAQAVVALNPKSIRRNTHGS